MKNKKILFVSFFVLILIISFSGCATIEPGENIPTYSISGVIYYPLIKLINSTATVPRTR